MTMTLKNGLKIAGLTLGIAMASAAGPAVAADDVLVIGAPLALTGGLADEGKKQQDVWKLWLDKINAAGGIDVDGKKMQVKSSMIIRRTESAPGNWPKN